jgi:hypothetical protein
MPEFQFLVIVDTATEENALQVMVERISVDEDYGFPYRIDFLSLDTEEEG